MSSELEILRANIAALILRYSQCVSMIQDQIFRGIAYVEQEDLSEKSNRDKTLLMEKLGAIKSADDFGSASISATSLLTITPKRPIFGSKDSISSSKKPNLSSRHLATSPAFFSVKALRRSRPKSAIAPAPTFRTANP